MIQKLMQLFTLGRCICQDSIHSGDEPDCPRHGPAGKLAAGQRLALVIVLFFLLLVLCVVKVGLGL